MKLVEGFSYRTISATLDDPEYDAIEIRMRCREPLVKPASSIGMERAILGWLASHLPSWVSCCIENGQKTL